MEKIYPKEECIVKTGTVQWYDPTKGHGMITADDSGEEVYLPLEHVPDPGNMHDGIRLQFETEQGIRGLRATNVTII